eukprot:m.71574 g.71574  ORF g.71574 m.71574 type:complete len:196 (-) comp12954_c1_seq2:169-756(-)
MAADTVSLAYRDLAEIPLGQIKNSASVRVLDLSHNAYVGLSLLFTQEKLCVLLFFANDEPIRLTEVKSLAAFQQLETLILDNNLLTSHVKLPFLPKLKTFWVNNNRITNLSIFIEHTAASFPDLIYLSMMNNEAAPSYFNGGTVQQYDDYRQFVISHFPKLERLDERPITAEERASALQLYGSRNARRRPSATPR